MSTRLLFLLLIAAALSIVTAEDEAVEKRRFLRKSRGVDEVEKRRFLRKSRGADELSQPEEFSGSLEEESDSVTSQEAGAAEKRRHIRKSRGTEMQKRRFLRKSRSDKSAVEENAEESAV